jgi:hypothetical protein
MFDRNWIRTMTPREGRKPRRTKARVTAADRRTGPAATYRDLVIRGFASTEAANLTAYLHDLPIEEQPWTLRQVNAVLFLRKLRETGQFGANDGGRSPFAGPQPDAA